MKTKEVTVTSRIDGLEVPALMIVCPECGGEDFKLLVLEDRHNHLQCARCEQMFCQGDCATVGRQS